MSIDDIRNSNMDCSSDGDVPKLSGLLGGVPKNNDKDISGYIKVLHIYGHSYIV